jgi:hypothetical protein
MGSSVKDAGGGKEEQQQQLESPPPPSATPASRSSPTASWYVLQLFIKLDPSIAAGCSDLSYLTDLPLSKRKTYHLISTKLISLMHV